VGPCRARSYAGSTGLHQRGAGDLFDALVALGLLDRDDDGYRNTAETDLYLNPAKPTYMGGMLEFHNTTVYQPWASLTEALRTGESQSTVKHLEDLFAATYADPDVLNTHSSAMRVLSAGPATALANTLP
jgi:hypothetical protein